MKKRILFIRTDRIGETLLVMPLLWYYWKIGMEVGFVGARWCEEIKDLFSFIDRWFFVDRQNLGQAILLGSRIRRIFKPEICIVFNPTKFGHFLSFSCGAGVRCGYGRKWSFLLNRKIDDKKDLGLHELEYNLILCQLVDSVCDGSENDLVMSDIVTAFREWLKEKVVSNVNLEAGKDVLKIVIHPFSSDKEKMISFDVWQQLIEFLSSKYSCRLYVVGCREERQRFSEICKICNNKNVVDFIGRLNLKDLFGLISRADLFVGIDSAPMHIAGILNIPTVGIYVKSSRIRWKMLSERNCIITAEKLGNVEQLVSSVLSLI